MKNIASNRRFYLVLFFLLAALNTALFPQGTESRKRPGAGGAKVSKMCITLYLNPAMTKVSSGEITGLSDLTTSGGNSLHGALDLDYFFSSAIGVNFGLGYNGFSSQLSLDSWSGKYSTKDSENETYEMRISGEKITEDQKIAYLSIPVCLSMRFPAGGKFGFYMKAGIGFDIPIVKSYEEAGVFSYAGYYAEYPVLLENLSEYGFPYKKNTSSSGTLEVKSFSPAIIASGDIFFSISKTMQILVGGYFNRSLSNISSYTPASSFLLSSKADELNSIMSASPGANVQAIGLSLGFRYFLK
jgi:hypothetical protein